MSDITDRFQALIPKVEHMRGDVVTVMIGQPAEVVLPRIKYFPDWEEGVWKTGENLMYKGHAYTVIAPGHDSTGNPSWTPDTQNALFKLWHGISKETALPFKQPQGQHDMYLVDEWMIFSNGEYYKCLVDTNFTPIELPSAWLKDGEVIEPEEPIGGEYLPWSQPPNETPFMMNAKVSHKGKNWHSTIDNNIWEPSVYGWEQDI